MRKKTLKRHNRKLKKKIKQLKHRLALHEGATPSFKPFRIEVIGGDGGSIGTGGSGARGGGRPGDCVVNHKRK